MKYYVELSKLESEIIRLDIVASLLRTIAEGSHNVSSSDITNSLWHISETIEDINAKASDSFQELWDLVREDSVESEDPTQYITPSKVSTELNDIVNSWARQ